MPEKEAVYACNLLMADLFWAYPTRWTCYLPLESALTNRWKGSSFALLVRGQAYLSHAWEARGTGMADTVNDQGWKLLEQRLAIAAESLEAAWKLDPTDVRICVEMMRVELGQHQGRSRLETWFQRGMNLDPGDADVCMEKLEYLRPRWYGSVPEMIAFGRECTTNTNYTGAASLMLAKAHREAAREGRSQEEVAAYWRQPEVWKDVRFAFEELFKRFPEETRFRQDSALYAYFSSQWSEVLKQAKMFPYTNYAFFGGVERFNRIVTTARDNAGKK